MLVRRARLQEGAGGDFQLEAGGRGAPGPGGLGDARRALSALEVAGGAGRKGGTITLAHVEDALQTKTLLYDKQGEEHYNVISAFIKSMRGSDPDAAVYYLVRMLECGQDPIFLARRMVIFAAEDVGNAEPRALSVAVARCGRWSWWGCRRCCP